MSLDALESDNSIDEGTSSYFKIHCPQHKVSMVVCGRAFFSNHQAQKLIDCVGQTGVDTIRKDYFRKSNNECLEKDFVRPVQLI